MIQCEIDDYATRSLRDTADGDYIVARMCYQYHLESQCLWSAHQAVEKYLKAILLYNRVSSRKLGHNLKACLAKVLAIEDIEFDVPEDVRDFIGYLDDEGLNRYFEFPYVIRDDLLFRLDRTVWVLRRYCRQLRIFEGDEADRAEHLNREISLIRAQGDLNVPHRSSLWLGYLEKVLEDKKKSELRQHLVWKNFYYGARVRTRIPGFPRRLAGGNPSHYLRPECFPELDRLVYFSPGVRKWIQQRLEEREA